MSDSLSFDRAADFYDATRRLPPSVATGFRDALLAEAGLPPGARLLEVGIGTGRIAGPFLEAGDRLSGVDLSLRMMAALRDRFPTAPLVQADMTELPFPAGRFDVVIAVHVFHLVARWEQALAEARRVLRVGGVLAWSWHWRAPGSLNRRLRGRLSRLAASRGYSTTRPGAQSPAEVVRALRWLGAKDQRVVEVARWQRGVTTARAELDALARRETSDTWGLPDAVLAELLEQLGGWVIAEYGDLDAAEPLDERMLLHLARFP